MELKPVIVNHNAWIGGESPSNHQN